MRREKQGRGRRRDKGKERQQEDRQNPVTIKAKILDQVVTVHPFHHSNSLAMGCVGERGKESTRGGLPSSPWRPAHILGSCGEGINYSYAHRIQCCFVSSTID